MMEFATANPWITFFMLVILLSVIESIVGKVKGCKDGAKLEIAEQQLFSAKVTIDNLESKLRVYQERERAKGFGACSGSSEGTSGSWEQYQRHEQRRQEDYYKGREEAFRRQEDYNNRYKAQQEKANTESKATWAEVKKKYREDMKRIHPDKVRARGGSKAEIAEATKQTQRLNELYEEAKRRFGK